jgi:hypothetical protein
MTTDAVTVQVTWDGKSDTITIVKVREGTDAIVGYLTNEAALIPADSAGTPTASLSTVGGTFKVYNGINDVTGSGVTYSVAATSNMTASIASTGIYTITGISADAGSVTFRAVVNGVTIDKVYSLAKSKQGATGATGSRGTVSLSRAVSGSSWSDTEANTAVSGAGYNTPINRDIVTLYNNAVSYSETRFFNGSAWITLDAYINGNLLVTGTVSSGALATGAVQTQHLAVSNSRNIVSNSAPGRGMSGWTIGYNSEGSPYTVGTLSDLTFCPSGAAAAWLKLNGGVGAGQFFDLINDSNGRQYPVKGNQRYELSGYISAHRCSVGVIVIWYDGAGNYIGEANGTAVNNNQNGNQTSIATFPRSTLFVTSPSNAARAKVGARATTSGAADPYIFLSMLYFGEANPSQTVYSPWSEGGSTYVTPSMIQTDNLSAISADVGYLTAGHLHGPVVSGGSFGTAYAWPAAGAGGGFHLSGSGLLIGNANTPGGSYVALDASGNLYSPKFTISGGNAIFSGTIEGTIVTADNIIDRSVSDSLLKTQHRTGNGTDHVTTDWAFSIANEQFVIIYPRIGSASNMDYAGAKCSIMTSTGGFIFDGASSVGAGYDIKIWRLPAGSYILRGESWETSYGFCYDQWTDFNVVFLKK